MFDFERLSVYQKAELYYKHILSILTDSRIDRSTRDQFRRASLSIVLNIAEGSGKYRKNDKKRFYVIAKGSVNECVAVLRILIIENYITKEIYHVFYEELTEIAKMLTGLIVSMNERKD